MRCWWPCSWRARFASKPSARAAGFCKSWPTAAGPIAVFSVASALQTFVDIIVLSKLVPPEVVGWYGAARNIMGVLFAPAAILSHRFLSLNSPATSRSPPGLRHVLRATSRLLLGLGALAAAGTFLFADVAVGLIYGHHFDPAVAVLQAFAPIFPLFFMDMLFGIGDHRRG